MAHVPEGRRVFAELSVYENLKMGAYTRKDRARLRKVWKMSTEDFRVWKKERIRWREP